MIKVEKIFPDYKVTGQLVSKITDKALPGSLYQVVLSKGFVELPNFTKSSKRIIYVIKGELECQVIDEHNPSHQFDFKASEGMLVKIPAQVSVGYKALKESIILYGSEFNGEDQSDILDTEYSKNYQKPLDSK